MALEPTNPAQPPGESPAGAAAEQKAVDHRRRRLAATAVASAVLVGGLIGFVLIPAAQKSGAHLTMGHAMARAAGLAPGSPAVPQPINTASPIPVSTVSWNPEIMAILAAGNSRRGAAIAAQTCAACHGDKGLSQSMPPGPIFPSLAGQSPYAIYKQLHDFQSGARVNPMMTPVAQTLSTRDLAAVAAYYSAASKEYTALGARQMIGDTEEIDRLATDGDSHRRIPACLACHVNNAGGPIETPVITGQSSDYILAQLNAFASGQRKNDVYGRMREVAGKLTPEERKALAKYFEGTL